MNLNVSGTLYQTSVPTLTADPEGYLAAMVAPGSKMQPYQTNGVQKYFLDRHAKLFQYILNHLRNQATTDQDMLPNDPETLSLLKCEAIFFGLKSLELQLDLKLLKVKDLMKHFVI